MQQLMPLGGPTKFVSRHIEQHLHHRLCKESRTVPVLAWGYSISLGRQHCTCKLGSLDGRWGLLAQCLNAQGSLTSMAWRSSEFPGRKQHQSSLHSLYEQDTDDLYTLHAYILKKNSIHHPWSLHAYGAKGKTWRDHNINLLSLAFNGAPGFARYDRCCCLKWTGVVRKMLWLRSGNTLRPRFCGQEQITVRGAAWKHLLENSIWKREMPIISSASSEHQNVNDSRLFPMGNADNYLNRQLALDKDKRLWKLPKESMNINRCENRHQWT